MPTVIVVWMNIFIQTMQNVHSDQNYRRHSHGDSHENAGGDHRLYDMLGFNATGPLAVILTRMPMRMPAEILVSGVAA